MAFVEQVEDIRWVGVEIVEIDSDNFLTAELDVNRTPARRYFVGTLHGRRARGVSSVQVWVR